MPRFPRGCLYCRKNSNWIDYTDPTPLRRHLGMWGKIKGRHETGTCAKHQRRVAEAIKRARHIALLPYSSR